MGIGGSVGEGGSNGGSIATKFLSEWQTVEAAVVASVVAAADITALTAVSCMLVALFPFASTLFEWDNECDRVREEDRERDGDRELGCEPVRVREDERLRWECERLSSTMRAAVATRSSSTDGTCSDAGWAVAGTVESSSGGRGGREEEEEGNSASLTITPRLCSSSLLPSLLLLCLPVSMLILDLGWTAARTRLDSGLRLVTSRHVTRDS